MSKPLNGLISLLMCVTAIVIMHTREFSIPRNNDLTSSSQTHHDDSTYPKRDLDQRATTDSKDGVGSEPIDKSEGSKRSRASSASRLVESTADEYGEINDDAAVNALREWITSNGGVIRRVSAQTADDAGGGRGLFATKLKAESSDDAFVLPGELLISVPASLWLSTRTALERSRISDILQSDDVVRAYTGTEGNLWTIIFTLEYERHQRDSFWGSYIRALPQPTSPVWWNKDELARFGSEAIVTEVQDLQHHIRTVYTEVIGHLCLTYPAVYTDCTTRHSLASFTWSALTVWGRAFDLGQYNSTETGLMPYMDFANHRHGSRTNTSWDYVSSFDFEAGNAYVDGNEIFISYGDGKSSMTYLLNYGFIPSETNFGDFITVIVGLDLSADEINSARKSYGVAFRTYNNTTVLTAHIGIDGTMPIQFVLDAVALTLKDRVNATAIEADANVRRVAGEIMQKMQRSVRIAVDKETEFDHHRTDNANDIGQGSTNSYDAWVVSTTRQRFTTILNNLAEHIDIRVAMLLQSKDTHSTASNAGTKSGSDSIVQHMHANHILLDSELAIRESLYHVHVKL